MSGRVASPVAGSRNWFTVPWSEVYARTGLTPQVLPGVRTAADHAAGKLPVRTDANYGRIMGPSARPPFPYRVHRSHLPIIGYAAAAVDVAVRPDAILRRHQVEGVRFIWERRGSILADAMRTGKTATMMYAHDPDAGPMVIAGPMSARTAHHEWAARRFGACLDVWNGVGCSICARLDAPMRDRPSFALLSKRKPDLRVLQANAYVYFMTYAVVGPWADQFNAFPIIGTLAIDECHLAGVQTRHSVTVQGIRLLNTRSNRVIMASGSPMWNRPSGLWPIVDIACPAAFGDFWSFAIRYSDAKPSEHGWTTDGVSNESELAARLSAIMLRRTWTDIQANLPPIVRSMEYVELTEKEHAQVFDMMNDLRKAVAAKAAAQTVVGNLARLRKLYARAKVAKAIELVIATLNEGHSVIVWTWHRDVAEALSDALGANPVVYGPIHGQLTSGAREQILDEVRGDTRPRVLIASMGALGTGVSLNWATHQVFVELDWTPAVMQQAEMRPYDGTRPISSVLLVADCDPDRRQADALVMKLEAAASLGLQSGNGDVAAVLSQTLAVDGGSTLDDVADLICAGLQ